jgi:carboxypeptidase C (cathepsin A)
MTFSRGTVVTLLALAIVGDAGSIGAPARAMAPRAAQSSWENHADGVPIVTTRHRISAGGRALSYTARAGLLPIRHNDDGEVRAHVFFMAYLLDRAPGDPVRPLTFLWNGGPGASSVLVHLVGFGPRRIRTADDPTGPPSCECEVEDNDRTWLDQTDLVFVDPVGTGFSRPTRPEYGADFYNTLGDIASIAEFVRVYRTRFDAWDAPLFVGGESYGVWRAAGVAETLERKGQRVRGVILISGGMAVGAATTGDVRTAFFVPTRTAAAFFHKRLAPDLQSDLQATLRTAEAWARSVYLPALARRASLSETEREAIVTELSRFTGLDRGLIDPQALAVSRQQFAEQLLRDKGRVLARFDARLTADAEATRPAERGRVVNRYLRSLLGFKTDLAYQGIEEGYVPPGTAQRSVNARWNYNSGEGSKNAPPSTDMPPGAEPWLLRAMTVNPSLKAFVAAGLYDSLNSCALNAHVIGTLEARFAENITEACYEGGHMMYDQRTAREQLKRDVTAFFRKALAGPDPRP